MIAALDVYYADTRAFAAAVVFESWNSERPVGWSSLSALGVTFTETQTSRLHFKERFARLLPG